VSAEQTRTLAADEGPKLSSATRPARSISHFLEAYALVGLLVACAVFFALWPNTSQTFPTAANLQILIGNQAVLAVIALGALIPLIANEWDLSIGAVAGVSSIFAASVLSNGRGIVVAILVGLGCGLVVGAANALIVSKVGVNGVIATLGVATVLDGVVNQRTGGLAVTTNIPDSWVDFGLGTVFGVPKIALAMAVVAVMTYYLLGYTAFGRYLHALGSNAQAASLVGIRVKRIIAGSFVASALLSAVGGVLQVARQAGADPRVGESFTLPALAAAFLSAAAIKPGRYNVAGTLVAIFFLAVINNGLSLAGVPAYVSNYVNGAALVVGVGLGAVLGRRRAVGRL
jgi:ribose transport system permease protein